MNENILIDDAVLNEDALNTRGLIPTQFGIDLGLS